MKKKTAEELRAANAARQAKWRGKHRWLAQQRKLAVYGKAKGQQKEEVEARVVDENNVIDNATCIEPVEGYDTPTEQYRERAQVFVRRRGGDGGAVVGVGPVEQRSPAHEVVAGGEAHRKAVARLEELKGRQARGQLNRGVEIELEI